MLKCSEIDMKTNKDKKVWAVTALVRKSGKILSCSRRNDSTKWGLPGGKIDPGETPLQAVIRELEEETDLKALDAIRIFSRPCPPEPWEVVCYCIVDWEGQPSDMEEGISVRWKTPQELIKGPFGHWNQKLFDEVGISYD